MVEIEDIVDRESLREWLEGQSREYSIAVASRMCLRTAGPILTAFGVDNEIENRDLAMLAFWRANLVGYVSSYRLETLSHETLAVTANSASKYLLKLPSALAYSIGRTIEAIWSGKNM